MVGSLVAAAGDPLWSDLRFGPGVVFADGVKKGAAQAVPLFSVATNGVTFELTDRKKIAPVAGRRINRCRISVEIRCDSKSDLRPDILQPSITSSPKKYLVNVAYF